MWRNGRCFQSFPKMGICLLRMIVIVAVCFPLASRAEGVPEFPKGVRYVKNEKELIADFVAGMQRHKGEFCYYYPGIEKDFQDYRQRAYRDFFEKVAKDNGYVAGIVSGYCVAICGTCPQYVSIQVCYMTTKGQEKRIDRKVKGIVKKIGRGSPVAKIRKTHDYLVRHMRYDSRYYSPYHAFFKGRGMCMAYALAFQRLMQEMGIPCLYVKGKNHAWNMVKVGKYWYNVDVTWDDSSSGYGYFLKCDEDFPGHKRPNSILFKGIRKAKRSYPM